MATYDLGDVVTLSSTVRDANGALANATTMVCTVTAPDGTTATPAVSNPTTGNYTTAYTPTVEGLHGVRWLATGTNAGSYRDSFTVLDTGIPLVSLDEIKARLNITDTTSDDELRRVAAAATARAAREVNRALAVRVLTQTVDMTGSGRSALVLPTPAILAVTAVTQDGDAVAAADYDLDPTGQVLRRTDGAAWGGQVAVTGTVGVTGDDLAIAQQAVLELIAHLWETQRVPLGRNPVAGPAPGMGYALPNRVAEMLSPLRLGGFG